MTSYLVPLLAIVLLCALWAIFQLGLSKHDPDATTRSTKCGACDERCERLDRESNANLE